MDVFSVDLPDGVVFLVFQESPVVGYRHRGAVGDCDYSLSRCAVEHRAKVNCGGRELEVGEIDLSMQPHHVLLWVSLVVHMKKLEKKSSRKKMYYCIMYVSNIMLLMSKN